MLELCDDEALFQFFFHKTSLEIRVTFFALHIYSSPRSRCANLAFRWEVSIKTSPLFEPAELN